MRGEGQALTRRSCGCLHGLRGVLLELHWVCQQAAGGCRGGFPPPLQAQRLPWPCPSASPRGPPACSGCRWLSRAPAWGRLSRQCTTWAGRWAGPCSCLGKGRHPAHCWGRGGGRRCEQCRQWKQGRVGKRVEPAVQGRHIGPRPSCTCQACLPPCTMQPSWTTCSFEGATCQGTAREQHPYRLQHDVPMLADIACQQHL